MRWGWAAICHTQVSQSSTQTAIRACPSSSAPSPGTAEHFAAPPEQGDLRPRQGSSAELH